MVYAKVANGLAHFKAKLKFRGNSFKLRANKTYIFPTGFGFSFAALCFILLVMAIGYGNNVLYFFVFLLAAMGHSGSWLTNNNIEYVDIKDLRTDFLFANEKNYLQLVVENKKPQKTSLFDIEMQTEHENSKFNELAILEHVQKKSELSVKWIPPSRGLHQAPRIMMQSRFPFKLLRSWKFYQSQYNFLIFPERKGEGNLQTLIGNQSQRDDMAKLETEGLFRDFREFQNSDAPNRIDWKRSIKHQKHLVKNYEKSGERKIIIDWDMTKNIESFEDRICQLSKWADLCFQNNENYSLRIKQQRIEYGFGASHYRNCLEKLATLKLEDTV